MKIPVRDYSLVRIHPALDRKAEAYCATPGTKGERKKGEVSRIKNLIFQLGLQAYEALPNKDSVDFNLEASCSNCMEGSDPCPLCREDTIAAAMTTLESEAAIAS
jgi:hypothetical protein